MDLNQLQKLMDFYKQSGVSQDYSSHQGFNATPYNGNADALRWATQMIGQDGQNGGSANRMPDFFGGQNGQASGGASGYSPASYVQPQQFQGRFQMPQAQQQPMTGQVNNYLAQLMGRR